MNNEFLVQKAMFSQDVIGQLKTAEKYLEDLIVAAEKRYAIDIPEPDLDIVDSE